MYGPGDFGCVTFLSPEPKSGFSIQATLLGLGTTSADWAALANGMAAHSMELDDTFLEGSIHNESFLYAATMALAEECGLSGPDFIAAIYL